MSEPVVNPHAYTVTDEEIEMWKKHRRTDGKIMVTLDEVKTMTASQLERVGADNWDAPFRVKDNQFDDTFLDTTVYLYAVEIWYALKGDAAKTCTGMCSYYTSLCFMISAKHNGNYY